jgi:hypothetical protein
MKLHTLCTALLAVIVSQCACRSYRECPIVEAWPSICDQEILASMAITRAVIKPGDVPDVQQLDRDQAIVLATATKFITMQGDTVDYFLTERSLPPARSVRFKLLTPQQIQAIANDSGDFVYLAVSKIKETADGAIVTVETKWAIGKNSFLVIMSGGGYELRFRKEGTRWIFDKVDSTWIS